MSKIELRGISKRFNETNVLRDVSLEIEQGELCVFIGPSGCGKSTLLRLIAGLDGATAGDIHIDDQLVNELPPSQRNVAMVFQSYALYPHMSVFENMAFGLRHMGLPKPDIEARVAEAARMLHLGPLLERKPRELSGGQRQRVAMGRAIVRRPRVFLFDEPLSNLDAALRQDLRVQIGMLVRELGVTAIYVTHDQVEAMTLADRICLMKKGEIQQIAVPRTIYEKPANSFVASFIGAPKMNLLDGKVSGETITCGAFTLPAPSSDLPKNVVVGVRPEDVKIVEAGPELTVAIAEPLGAETNLVLKGPNDLTLRARTHGFDPRAPGSKVNVSLEGARFHVFAADDYGRRL